MSQRSNPDAEPEHVHTEAEPLSDVDVHVGVGNQTEARESAQTASKPPGSADHLDRSNCGDIRSPPSIPQSIQALLRRRAAQQEPTLPVPEKITKKTSTDPVQTDHPNRAPEPVAKKRKALTRAELAAVLAGDAVVPDSDHPKQQRLLPTERVRRSSDQSAPLPYFKKPAPTARAAADAYLLRRPPDPHDNRKPDRRSRSEVAAENAARAELALAQLPQPGQIPELLDIEPLWHRLIQTYGSDPVAFTEDLLGVQPNEWQAEAMQAVARDERRLSVRAGHGVGKTAFCAWLVIWQMVVRFPQRTVVTAPTAAQLFGALFNEIKLWARKLPPPILDLFEIQSEAIIYKASPEQSKVEARTASRERPEALAGVHCQGGWVLLVCDEASAIDEKVYEPMAGSMSGRASCILISNPTRLKGTFYDSQTKLSRTGQKRDSKIIATWLTMHVSCIGSSLVDPDFVQDITDRYGLGSNAYKVRVLGQFPTQEDDVLIDAALIDAATRRDVIPNPNDPLTWGVDVSRFGDDRTVIIKRRGQVVVGIKWWSKLDIVESTNLINAEAQLDRPDEICVDSIGLGAGLADNLRHLGFNVLDVNVSEGTAQNPGAAKLRDDLWLQVRDWFQTKAVQIPDDEDLIADLKAPTYGFSERNRLVVESKKMMKRRGLRSPDFADALCMTFAGQSALVGGRVSSAWSNSGWDPSARSLAGVV